MRSKVTCSERYLGSTDDIERIVDTLRLRRQQALTPVYMASHLYGATRMEIPPDTRFRLLFELLADRDVDCFDHAFFEHAISTAEACLHDRFSGFSSLPLDAYIVADSKSDNGSSGGFHGRLGVGFQYGSNFGFSELLNTTRVADGTVRAYELARNYIHDSFHAATCRSFGWHDGNVFRYQYGINFRLPSGISYSSARSDPARHFTINLNVLMDGITALVTAYAMRSIKLEASTSDDYARDLIDDVRGDFSAIGDEQILRFANTVVRPSECFLEYWGNKDLLTMVGQTMLDGTLAQLRAHFERARIEREDDRALSSYLGARRTAHGFLGRCLWEDLFLSSDFRRELIALSPPNQFAASCGLDIN